MMAAGAAFVAAADAYNYRELTVTSSKPVEVRAGLFDFGKDGIGWLEFHSAPAGEYEVVLGEMTNSAGKVANPFPGSTIRCQRLSAKVEGDVHRLAMPPDRWNLTGYSKSAPAIRMPEWAGIVFPFRYVEIVKSPGPVKAGSLVRKMVHHPIDMAKSSFECENATLNEVYEFCKYSMLATSFTGIYVDGDRERTPYEADAYINQLGHYAIDNDYTMGRKTVEWMMDHETWPTEWKQHQIMMCWADWMWTGDTRSIAKNWDKLVSGKLLSKYARESDGLLVTGGEHRKGCLIPGGGDIVDWPAGERDGFVFKSVNAVVNAFYCLNLRQLSEMAAALGKNDEAKEFAARAKKIAAAYRKVFYNPRTKLFVDGEGTDHSSLHANAAALAFGLVTDRREKESIVNFLRGKGMACSVYFAQYLLEAFVAAGRADLAIKAMASTGERSWKGMIDFGSTVAMEAWNVKAKPNLDLNHAWGAAPLNVISRCILGVTPLEPGFAKIGVKPETGILKKLSARVPVANGIVKMEIDGPVLKLEVPAPAKVVWAEREYDVGAGSHVFGLASETGDAAEIMRAVRAASASGGGVVKLERRVWKLKSSEAAVVDTSVSNHDHHRMQHVALPFVGITNVTLDASGSTFRMEGDAVAFAAVDSLGVSLKDVRIEWARPFFAELEVVAFERGGTRVRFNPERFDCRVNAEGELMLHGEDWVSKLERAHFVERESRACVRQASDWYLRKPKVALGNNEILLGEDLSQPILGKSGVGLKAGDVVVIRSATRPRPAMFLYRAKDTCFDKVFVSGGMGMGLIAQRSENVTFTNGGVVPQRPDEFSSHTVDATHFSSVKGKVVVENSRFEGMLDDAINIHATSLIIEDIIGRRAIRCRDYRMDGKGYELFRPGERVRFINGDTLENGSMRTVVKVENLAEDEMVLTLDGDVPEGYRIGDAIEDIDWFADIVFRGNVVCNNRARAVLFTTTKSVLCENNVFRQVSGAGIRISGDAVFWYETGAASLVTVRGNVFDGCQRRAVGGAVIIVDPMVKKLERQRHPYHRKLVVEKNEFKNVRDGKVISAYSLEELVWRGNRSKKVKVENPKPMYWSVTER
jgi:hypothetical protein